MEDVQYRGRYDDKCGGYLEDRGGYLEYCGGYHEYRSGSVPWRYSNNKIFGTGKVLNIPDGKHDVPPRF